MKVKMRLYILVVFIVACLLYLFTFFREGFQESNIKFGVMAIFKNEAMGIREWIEHYKWQGVDKILLLDNNSTDDWREKIAGLEGFVTVLSAPRNHTQKENYVDIGFPWVKENGINVLAILDIDEYMFGRDGKNLKGHITEVFGSAGRPSQFSCGWTMFGSSGHITQPGDIRATFTWKRTAVDDNVKSVVWVDDIVDTTLREDPHYYYRGVNQHKCKVSGESIGCPAGIQLNHYVIQSKEYYEKVKIMRGDVDKMVNTRDWDYFNRHDYKEEEDLELKRLVV